MGGCRWNGDVRCEPALTAGGCRAPVTEDHVDQRPIDEDTGGGHRQGGNPAESRIYLQNLGAVVTPDDINIGRRLQVEPLDDPFGEAAEPGGINGV